MPKILVVEDNKLTTDLVVDLLELVPCEVLTAEDAETGIVMAREHQPDLILMDIHLPGKNGYEASDILKADTATESIKILAFTAANGGTVRQKAIQHGCAGLIPKPINVDTFAETVLSYCD